MLTSHRLFPMARAIHVGVGRYQFFWSSRIRADAYCMYNCERAFCCHIVINNRKIFVRRVEVCEGGRDLEYALQFP